MTIRELIGNDVRIVSPAEKVLWTMAAYVTIFDVYEAVRGNFEAFSFLTPAVGSLLAAEAATPEGRKSAAKRIVEEFKAGGLVVPPEAQKNLLPGVDPACLIEQALLGGVEQVLTEYAELVAHRDRARFAERIRSVVQKTIAACVAELAEGFANEVADVEALLRHSVSQLLRKVGGESLGATLEHIAAGPLFEFMMRCYRSEAKGPARTRPVEEEKKKPQVPAVLTAPATTSAPAAKEEEKKSKPVPAEETKAVPPKPAAKEEKKVPPPPPVQVPEKWKETLDKDMAAQAAMKPQRPFSHVYLATDPQRGPQSVPRVNESPLKKEMREGMKLMKMGDEDIAKVLEGVGKDVENCYLEFIRAEYRNRAAHDPDFDAERHKYLKRFIDGAGKE